MNTSEQSRSDRAVQRRVLVTGGAGFIGGHLAEVLVRRGDHVTIVDNVSTGRASNLAVAEHLGRPGTAGYAGGGLRFIEGDLAPVLAALGPGERFDEIYHLAAAVGVKLVMDQPVEAIDVNIAQTLALLRFAMTRKSQTGAAPRTLIASSSEVYGKSPKAAFAEDDDVVYGPTTVARWSYAYSKAIDEFLALSFSQHQGLPAVVVRFFNTVGPRQVGAYGMVLPRFVAAALRNEPLQVYGDGMQTRCFCDVRDVVEALPTLLGSETGGGRVFNVGSDRPITIRQLAELVIRLTESRSVVELVPYDRVFSKGFEDLHDRRPDLTRIRREIGFAPRVRLEQTISDIAAFLRAGG